jgi:hypothetical protein
VYIIERPHIEEIFGYLIPIAFVPLELILLRNFNMRISSDAELHAREKFGAFDIG